MGDLEGGLLVERPASFRRARSRLDCMADNPLDPISLCCFSFFGEAPVMGRSP